MRIANIVPVIAKRYLNTDTRKRTLFLRGPSGIGKSDVVHQASEFLRPHVDGWQGVIDLRLGQMEPTDLRGIPHIIAGLLGDARTEWARPSFLPQTGGGIVFLDEITSAPPSVQAAAYQLCLTPADFGVPPEWTVLAAGNNKSDRGVTFNLAAPLQNRMCDVQVTTSLDDFTDYAIGKVRPEVLSFLRERPDLLHKFDPASNGGQIGPFPSPRSWFAASHVLDLDLPTADRVELFGGDLGSEAAVTFEAHTRLYESMPKLDDILAGKDIPMPKDLSIRYCLAMGLATRLDATNFEPAYKFLQKMPGDVQTLTVKLAYKRDKGLASSPAFTQWATANQAAWKRS
jgi:hypothetical protein